MIHNVKRITAVAALVLAALPAHAQFGPGRMMPSTIDPDTYRPGYKYKKDWPAPQPGFMGGVTVIPGYGGGYYGGGYCQPGVVVVPGYTGGYYGGYYGGYGSYNSSRFSVGVNLGGLSLGYQQRSGYVDTYVPPVVPYGGDTAYRNYDNAGADRSIPREQPTVRRNRDDGSDNDYYLHRKPSSQRDASLTDAVADIQAAFRTGDVRRLEKHIDKSGTITLQSLGRTRQQLAANDYVQMTADALKAMKTVRYNLDKVEPGSNGTYMVLGTHVIKTDDGEKTFNVGFVLEKKGDTWLIKEVSADPAK